MNVAKEKVVSIHYKLTNNDGEVLDSSEGREPLNYIQGMNNLIPGLENALEGKTTGDKFDVTIPPAEAYGERREDGVQPIPRTAFGEIQEIQPGQQFQMNSENGPVLITVVDVKDEEVVVDTNHPLAGETLNFEVEVMKVRDASAEEIEHGHVHGEGGHHH